MPGATDDPAVYLADTSAWIHADHPSVRSSFAAAVAAGGIVTTPSVVFELLYVARNAQEFDRLSGLRSIPLSRSVTDAAHRGLRELARRAAGRHRVPVPDLLVAAAAQDAGLGVLHYDRHFDRLAEVMDFESRWIAPAGSL
jgi:predicted nucleic acid-binding protein